jgi:hypothetical protein
MFYQALKMEERFVEPDLPIDVDLVFYVLIFKYLTGKYHSVLFGVRTLICLIYTKEHTYQYSVLMTYHIY